VLIVQIFIRFGQVSIGWGSEKEGLTNPKELLVNGVPDVVHPGEEPIYDPIGEWLRRKLLDELSDLARTSTSLNNPRRRACGRERVTHLVRRDAAVRNQALEILCGCTVNIKLHIDLLIRSQLLPQSALIRRTEYHIPLPVLP